MMALTATERARRCRDRARMAKTNPLAVSADVVGMLVDHGLIVWERSDDKRAMAEAVESLLTKIARGEIRTGAK